VQREQLLRRGYYELWPEQEGVLNDNLHIEYNDTFKTTYKPNY
jgi:hypothetical protein